MEPTRRSNSPAIAASIFFRITSGLIFFQTCSIDAVPVRGVAGHAASEFELVPLQWARPADRLP